MTLSFVPCATDSRIHYINFGRAPFGQIYRQLYNGLNANELRQIADYIDSLAGTNAEQSEPRARSSTPPKSSDDVGAAPAGGVG
jgi:hypothetical protein